MEAQNRVDYKRILHINLNDITAEAKVVGGMSQYIGGTLTSLRLLEDFYDLNPIIVSTGLLAGIYPYVSKTNLVFLKGDTLVEKYGGGTIGVKMNFAGIDAIVISGHTEKFIELNYINENIVIKDVSEQSFIEKESDLKLTSEDIFSNGYFSFGQNIMLENFMGGGLKIKIDNANDIPINNHHDYKKLYSEILDSYKLLDVEPRNNPSCLGCPIGCDLSNVGEDDLNISILPRTLVACGFAANIYKSIPLVFSCFDALDYHVTHSQLENIPTVYSQLKEKIMKVI